MTATVDRTGADFDALAMIDPARFAQYGYPHDLWRRLRTEDPVHWCEPEGYRPFWAVTTQAEIRHISTHPEQFLSAPRLTLQRKAFEDMVTTAFPETASRGGLPLRMLVNIDPPEHRELRSMAGPFFRPSVLRTIEKRVETITTGLLDTWAGTHELDFVADVASWHPLRMICEILGVAADDEGVILKITNELFGAEDPEFSRPDQFLMLSEVFAYFSKLIFERRAEPRDDLAGVIANARLANSEHLPDLESVSYLVLVATAGHDTTRNSLSGGLRALIEHPDELAKLRDDPSLIPLAADEIVRWTSPVIHFIRTAVADCEIGGKQIRAGDALALFYPSANRDESVFADPDTFRVDRDPNPHLAFGVGEHFCLGANLARMEIRKLLEQLVPRLESVELCGEPQYLAANFVGGIKHLPIRWTLR